MVVLFRWLPIMTSWRKAKQSWMLRKHTHIPDNDYWGICLFHVVWTNFFCNYSYVVHMEYIYIYIFPSTEQCAWADNLPERVQILGHAHIICITVQENIIILVLSNILRFTLKICFWADFNVMQLILVKIKWHIRPCKINYLVLRYWLSKKWWGRVGI